MCFPSGLLLASSIGTSSILLSHSRKGFDPALLRKATTLRAGAKAPPLWAPKKSQRACERAQGARGASDNFVVGLTVVVR